MKNRATKAHTRWTATELRKIPAHARDAILEAAAISAEKEYRTNPELTVFEAFGRDDLTAKVPAPKRGERTHGEH